MRDVYEGPAKLKSLERPEIVFDVECDITIISSLQRVRNGFPPVLRQEANLGYIRTMDDTFIPAGEYLLERPGETNRVKTFGFGEWHVLSWPMV